MDLIQMNTVTKLLTSPLLSTRFKKLLSLSINARPRPTQVRSSCQSSPGHAPHKYVLPVNQHQATPLPCLLHKQQQLERE